MTHQPASVLEELTTHVRRIADALSTPATTCSAQRRVAFEAEPRQCIRAANHTGISHTDDQGYRWSDTVAVYPTDSMVRIAHWHPAAEQLTEERQELAGMVGEFIDAQMRMAPAADEDAQRATRRESLLNLLARLQRGGMTAEEKVALRQHTETEMREVDTARAVAAGNKRHVQIMYADLQQAQKERDTADHVRAEVQRDRDQHAAVLTEVLAAFVTKVGGYRVPRRSAEVDVVTLDKWRSVLAPVVDPAWWEQVETARAELKQAQAAIERVRAMATTQRERGRSGSTDHKIGLYDAAVAILAALDGTEQPTTETEV